MNNTNKRKLKRKLRIGSHVRGTAERPRLSVFRSNDHMYVQIINDALGKTICGMSEQAAHITEGNKSERAKALGTALAKAAQEKKVTQVVFDKGSYQYHGRVKALAEGAREGGLSF